MSSGVRGSFTQMWNDWWNPQAGTRPERLRVWCREYFKDSGPVVFGWVFASHQFGAAIAATATGVLRDRLGNYDLAWYIAGGLSITAAALSLMLLRSRRPAPHPTPVAVAA